MRLLLCVIFVASNLYSLFFMFGCLLCLFCLFGCVVLCLGFRYDGLIYLAWRRFLTLALNYLLFFVGVRAFAFSLL
jgi:NADH:ubiquinone oxidoreductase subunit H